MAAAVRRRLVAHLGGRPLAAAELSRLIEAGISLDDVLQGHVELDLFLLAELEDVFGVSLWPGREVLEGLG